MSANVNAQGVVWEDLLSYLLAQFVALRVCIVKSFFVKITSRHQFCFEPLSIWSLTFLSTFLSLHIKYSFYQMWITKNVEFRFFQIVSDRGCVNL